MARDEGHHGRLSQGKSTLLSIPFSLCSDSVSFFFFLLFCVCVCERERECVCECMTIKCQFLFSLFLFFIFLLQKDGHCIQLEQRVTCMKKYKKRRKHKLPLPSNALSLLSNTRELTDNNTNRTHLHKQTHTHTHAHTLQCPYSLRVQLHASTSVCTLRIPNAGGRAIVWTHRNTAQTDRNR